MALSEKQIEEYCKSSYSYFIKNFDVKLSEYTESERVHSKVIFEDDDYLDKEFDYIPMKEIEKDFLRELVNSLNKRNNELLLMQKEYYRFVYKEIGITEEEYYNTEDLEKIEKYDQEISRVSKLTQKLTKKDIDYLMSFNFKIHFLNNKLEKLNFSYRILERNEIEFNEITKKKKINSLLISGLKPNISERYKIAIELLDIYNIINKKNISATEKHSLLAHIMGCSQQVARELFNGTQIKRTPVREEIIKPYLENLK